MKFEEYKIGDRVRYINRKSDEYGDTGTIKSFEQGTLGQDVLCWIAWDSDGQTLSVVNELHIELETKEIKPSVFWPNWWSSNVTYQAEEKEPVKDTAEILAVAYLEKLGYIIDKP